MYLRAIGRHFTQMNAYFLAMNSKRCSTPFAVHYKKIRIHLREMRLDVSVQNFMPVVVFQTPPYVFEFPDARCRPGFLLAGSPLYIHCNANYSVCITESRPTEIRVDISRPEIQRRMGEFGKQQLLVALHRNIDSVTAAKGAQWYRFTFE